MIKNIVEYLIAIAVIPAIVLAVVHVTELKDVRNVQYELLSEEEGIYNITPGTYEKLVANKRIKNYELESNYPLITQEEMNRATWKVNEELKNEIYIDENGEKRIRLNVGQITFDGSENWGTNTNQYNDVTEYYYVFLPLDLNIKYATGADDIVNAIAPGFEASSSSRVWSNETTDEVFTFTLFDNVYVVFRVRISKERLSGRTINEYLSQNPLTVTYELADKQSRPVEVYDFSKFRLTYDKNRIIVIFDIDDGYYLWEITSDDKMIPINGQYDLGNIWTVKFYVYEIQQKFIRTLVLLIPLIVISGLLIYQYDLLKKKGLS